MGFYRLEPYTIAKAWYIDTGTSEPGHITLVVQGEAPNFTSGVQLVLEDNGQVIPTIKVMGWTGPRAEGTLPYTVQGTFPGEFVPDLILRGSNKQEKVPVIRIGAQETEKVLLEIHQATVGQPAPSA